MKNLRRPAVIFTAYREADGRSLSTASTASAAASVHILYSDCHASRENSGSARMSSGENRRFFHLRNAAAAIIAALSVQSSGGGTTSGTPSSAHRALIAVRSPRLAATPPAKINRRAPNAAAARADFPQGRR